MLMKKSNPPMSCLFVALLFVLSVCSCSAASTCPLVRASGAADSDKTGYHIVVLKDGTTHERFEDIKSKVVSMTEDKKVHGSVETIVKAFSVKLSDDALSNVSVFNIIIIATVAQTKVFLGACMEFVLPISHAY